MSRARRAPQRGRPPAADSARRRHDILVAARRRFAAQGYAATTLSAIAKDAGITLAALYHYFDDKTALYEAVFDASIEILWNGIESQAAKSGLAGARLVALVDTIERAATRMDDETQSTQMFLTTVPLDAMRHPELRHLLDKRAEIQERQIRRIVAPAFDAGELPAFADINTAVAAVRILIMGWGIENYYLHDDTVSGNIREAAEVLLKQMVKPALRAVDDDAAAGAG
ncbi:TetR/AcrR family transcriptional regulator [Geodermatophilus sp. URMC 64]